MAYSTQADIEGQVANSELVILTDDNDTGNLVVARITEAIARADTAIDYYCQSVYSVPFSTVPDIIKWISVDIAVYNLYLRRRVEDMPDTINSQYEMAIEKLKDIQKGVVKISDAVYSSDMALISVNKSDTDRKFTNEYLER